MMYAVLIMVNSVNMERERSSHQETKSDLTRTQVNHIL